MESKYLEGIPIYECNNTHVPAQQFNFVRIALKRLKGDIHIELPRLRTLELILERDAWVVVDRSLNNIPVLAWTDFQTEHRSNLHEPIPCQLRLYHVHGSIIIDKVIEAMNLILGERLAALQVEDVDDGNNVIRVDAGTFSD